MEFLLKLYFVFFIIFIFSFIVNLSINKLNSINKIDTQISYGFILYSLWFLILFKFFDINKIGLIFFTIIIVLLIINIKSKLNFIQSNIKILGKTFFIYFTLYNIFLIPLLLSYKFGPFSEGSGDITIYANTVELFYKYNIPAFGYEDFTKKINEMLPFLNIPNKIIFLHYDLNLEKFNLPYPLYDSERLLGLAHFPTGWFSPVAQWYFFFNDSTVVFFALLGFLYASTVYMFYKIVCNMSDNKFIKIISLLLILSSHSLISIYYNFYLPQTISIFLLIFLLRLYFDKEFKLSVFKIFVVLSYSSLTYFPFIGITLLISVANLSKYKQDEYRQYFKKTMSYWHILLVTVIFLFALFDLLIYLLPSIMKMYNNIGSPSERYLLYLSNPIDFFSMKFFSYLSGILSLQHFPPYTINNEYITLLIYLNIVSLLIILSIIVLNFKKDFVLSHKLFFIVSGFILLIYIFLGKSFEYTLAKGLQYILLLIYLIIIYFIVRTIDNHNSKYKRVLQISFLIFIISMLFVRIDYVKRIAGMEDRASTINYSEIKNLIRITNHNSNTIILFEPRKSSDVYLIPQLFYKLGLKYLPTKDLSINSIDSNSREIVPNVKNDLISNDFIDDDVINNLYLIKWNKQNDKFNIHSFLDLDSILSAHYYEKDFREETINDKKLLITYIRNGNILLNLNKFNKERVTLYIKGLKDNKQIFSYLKNYKYSITSEGWISIVIELKDNQQIFKSPKIWEEYYISISRERI